MKIKIQRLHLDHKYAIGEWTTYPLKTTGNATNAVLTPQTPHTMKKTGSKYNYLKVIQQHYGQGWEDVSEYETNSMGTPKEQSDKLSPKGKKESLLSHDLREYRFTQYPTRVIFRKELNN